MKFLPFVTRKMLIVALAGLTLFLLILGRFEWSANVEGGRLRQTMIYVVQYRAIHGEYPDALRELISTGLVTNSQHIAWISSPDMSYHKPRSPGEAADPNFRILTWKYHEQEFAYTLAGIPFIESIVGLSLKTNSLKTSNQ